MAVGLEQFVKSLEDSGIITPSKLKAVREKLPSEKQQDAQELARELVRLQKLTKFQAQEAYQGKAKNLVLGNYVILDKIGAGGMGQVYKAQHRRMDRIVAIKMLPSSMTKDVAAIARFEREVKAAAKLRHTNIVAADDADAARGIHFLVMEFVEGSDLSALVKKNGPFSVAKSIDYVLQAAKGLEYAHKKGVVHRDIKPANLLLDTEGTVKILDMGLARLESGIGGEAATAAELTTSGQIMGTVDYMSPEQAFNTKQADARADIYSLGCTLFYLLTGKAVFGGETIMEKLLAHREKPIPSLRDLRDDVPEEVEAVYQKMVAKKIEDRYQAMAEIISDLQPFVGGGSTMMSTVTGSTNAASSNSNLTFLKEAAAGQTIQRKTRQIKQSKTNSDNGKQPWKNVKILIGAGAVGLALLLGVILIVRGKDDNELARIDAADATKVPLPADGSVQVQQGGSTNTTKTMPIAVAERPSQSVDLLKLISLNRDVIEGDWRFDGDKLVNTATAGEIKHNRVTIPYEPPLEYQLQLVVERVKNSPGQINIGIVVNGRQAVVCVDAFTNPNRTALESIDNKSGKSNETSHEGQLLELNKPTPIEVRVRPAEVTLTCEGKSVFHWTGSANRLGLFPIWKVPDPKVLFVGSQAGIVIHKMTLIPTTKTTPVAKSPSQSVDLLKLIDLKRDVLDGEWKMDQGALVTHETNKADLSAKGLLQLRVTPSDNYQLTAVVQRQTEAVTPLHFGIVVNGTQVAACVGVGDKWDSIRLERADGHYARDKDNPTRKYDGAAPFNKESPHTIVIVVSGPRVTITFDGKIAMEYAGGSVLSLSDYGGSSARLGRLHSDQLFLGSAGAYRISNLEYLPLEEVRANETPASITQNKPDGPTPPLAIAPFDAVQAKQHQQAWAKHLGIEVETPNSVGMKMVLIPPGEFLMGSTDEQVEAALKVADEIKADQPTKDRIQKNERPQHKVVITKPFWMSSTEVTIGQFKKFCATGFVTEAEKAAQTDSKVQTYLDPGYVVTEESPAAAISWNDAVAYCQWLSSQDKRIYRLPTEAEWEYTCRAGTTTQYSFGDDYSELPKYGWHHKNADGKQHPVGTLQPNPFGLFDMHGNLYEWCGDGYDEGWYEKTPPNDPFGPSGSAHVIRGGNWLNHASNCRSAARYSSPPSTHFRIIGFRYVSELKVPLTPIVTTTSSSPELFLHDPAFPQWMAQVQAMPAEEQVKAVSKRLVELNPGFDGKMTDGSSKAPQWTGNQVVTGFGINSKNVTDISPIRALAGLKRLWCVSLGGNSKLSNLSPLAGLDLSELFLVSTEVADLSPILRCENLTKLNVKITKVTPAQVAALQKALPNCKIEWDDPAKVTTPQPAASGTK